MTLTNDGEFSNEKDFESQFWDVDSMGAKMSLYVLETNKVTRQWTERWIARGFEISGHPDDTREAAGPVWSNMDKVLSAKMKEISDLYGTNVNNKGIPVWTASKLAEFVKMRDEARFTGISWSANKLSFTLSSYVKHSSGLTIMVPLEYGNNRITGIECNGKEVKYIERSVKGYDYAFVTVKPGAEYSLIIDYAH